jgi:uncharacterized membrane protein YfcA
MNMALTDLVPGAIALIGISVSFFVSASAGLGGSLVLVPVLVATLGPREGVTLAAILLAGNNLVKLWVYRQVLPVRAAVVLAVCTAIGALAGARLLVSAPEALVGIVVVVTCAAALLFEAQRLRAVGRFGAWAYAFAAGATSGFSGTSGPLKGVAVRSCGFDRLHTVGAATLVSAAGDITKTAVFAGAGLVTPGMLPLAVVSIPLMIAATVTGRRFTQAIGERGYAALFWLVIAGYAARLLAAR